LKKNIPALVFIGFLLLITACKKNSLKTDVEKTSTDGTDNRITEAVAETGLSESSYETDGAKLFNRAIDLKKPPMNGQDVLDLQNRLLGLRFNEIGDADGYYGQKTGDAIKFINWVLGFRISNPVIDTSDFNYKVDKALWDLIFDNKNDRLLTSLSLLKNLFEQNNDYPRIEYKGESLAVSGLKETVIRENNTGFDFWNWAGETKREYSIMGIPVIEFISNGHEYQNYNRYFFMPNGLMLRETSGGAESIAWQYFSFIDNERELHKFVNGDPLPTEEDAKFLYSEYKDNDSYLMNGSLFSD